MFFSISWDSFSHDESRSRAYRWGEDGLLGICDRQCRLCFSVALWNEHDSILKERLFGFTGEMLNLGAYFSYIHLLFSRHLQLDGISN